jgi:signal transduction histidine kinase
MKSALSFFEVGRAASQYRRILWAIWIAAAMLIALVGWHVIRLTHEDYERQSATAQRDLANLTRISQEHASRTLRSADQVVQFVQERYEALGNKLDLVELTRRGVIDAEIFNQVGIIDAKGIYRLANLPVSGSLDLSDREHFRVHVTADTGALFVSKPVVGRASGKWSIQLTRRINHRDGSFAGVVVLSVDPRYFTQFYGELELGAQGVMALYGLDGIGRARRMGSREEFGSQGGQSLFFDQLRHGHSEGSYTEHSGVDGVERLYFFRKIPNYPLVTVAGRDINEMLANHIRTRDDLRLQAIFLAMLILLLAGALSRFLFRIRRAMQARLAAQRQAQERTEQLDGIFALSPDGFISFDQTRRISYVNPAFYQMVGLDDLRLEGMDERDFSAWLVARCVSGRSFAGIDVLRAQVRGDDGPDVRVKIEVLAPVKRVLEVGLRVNPSGLVSQLLYFRDITVESEVDAMKSEFMATAAHELRTPMTSILGFTEILLTQDHDAASQREFLSIVLERSQLMTKILDELLDLARIEARRGQDFHYTLVEVQNMVTDVTRSLRVPSGRLPPVLNLPTEPLLVMADATKLKQAISNVLSNAYKYSSAGGKVLVDVLRQPSDSGVEQVCIKVTDKGIGMSPDQTRQIFDRFYRADASGKVLGTGLGMSIVKEIIDLHQGAVTVDSALGQGTGVSLCLPMQINPS